MSVMFPAEIGKSATAKIVDLISEDTELGPAQNYSTLTRAGNIVDCIVRFNKEGHFSLPVIPGGGATKVGEIPIGFRPYVNVPNPYVNFNTQSVASSFAFISTDGTISMIGIDVDRLDAYFKLSWVTIDPWPAA